MGWGCGGKRSQEGQCLPFASVGLLAGPWRVGKKGQIPHNTFFPQREWSGLTLDITLTLAPQHPSIPTLTLDIA